MKVIIALSSVIFFMAMSPAKLECLACHAIVGIIVSLILLKLSSKEKNIDTNLSNKFLKMFFCSLLGLMIALAGVQNLYVVWMPSTQVTSLALYASEYLNWEYINNVSSFLNIIVLIVLIASLPFSCYLSALLCSKIKITYRSVIILLSLFSVCNTDSTLIVYLIFGLTGILLERTTQHFESKVYNIASVIFALCVLLSNYMVFSPLCIISAIRIVLVFMGTFYIAQNIMYYCSQYIHCEDLTIADTNCKSSGKKVFVYTFLAIIILDSIVLLFAVFPGNLSSDSMSQITQIIEGEYSNHHPFYHTILIKAAYSIGIFLFNDVNKAISVYFFTQIILMAGAFSYTTLTLAQSGVSRLLVAMSMLLYIAMPYHVIMSVTMWKNVPFSLCVLVYITALFRIYRKVGNKIDLVIMAIAAVGINILQSNGWIAFIACSIAFIILFKRNYICISIANIVALTISMILLYPVMDSLNVTRGDFIEALSIPSQQIARVIVEDGTITDQQLEELNKVVDTETVKMVYDSGLSDPIKDLVRSKNNQDYLKQHKMDYLRIWFEIGIKNPWTYIKAWIDQTKGYWNGGYTEVLTVNTVYDNTYGFNRIILSPLISRIYSAIRAELESSTTLIFFKSIGAFMWIALGCFLINIVNKRKETAFLAIPPLLVIATLLISTPVYCVFRYAYSLFTCMPLIISATFVDFHFEKCEIYKSVKKKMNKACKCLENDTEKSLCHEYIERRNING